MSATASISKKLFDALQAYVLTVDHGKRTVNPEEWESHLDWATLERNAKAAMEEFDAGPQHEDERRWVMSVVVVSTDHVSAETVNDFLQLAVEDHDPSIGKLGDGFIVYTHEDVDGIPEDMPHDLVCVLKWAIKQGYSHVRLDPDGDYVTGLRDYEEESK